MLCKRCGARRRNYGKRAVFKCWELELDGKRFPLCGKCAPLLFPDLYPKAQKAVAYRVKHITDRKGKPGARKAFSNRPRYPVQIL